MTEMNEQQRAEVEALTWALTASCRSECPVRLAALPVLESLEGVSRNPPYSSGVGTGEWARARCAELRAAIENPCYGAADAELQRRLWIIVQALEPFTDKDAMDVYLRAEYENLLALSKTRQSVAPPPEEGTA